MLSKTILEPQDYKIWILRVKLSQIVEFHSICMIFLEIRISGFWNFRSLEIDQIGTQTCPIGPKISRGTFFTTLYLLIAIKMWYYEFRKNGQLRCPYLYIAIMMFV